MVYVRVERGITKRGNKFWIVKKIDGKLFWDSFYTLEEAQEAHQAYREERAEAKAAARADARANAPVNPDREANIAKKGGNSAQERNFIINVFKREAKAQGFEVRVLNDSTRSDVCIKRSGEDLYLPIQVKTTQGVVSGRERTYQFRTPRVTAGCSSSAGLSERNAAGCFAGTGSTKGGEPQGDPQSSETDWVALSHASQRRDAARHRGWCGG